MNNKEQTDRPHDFLKKAGVPDGSDDERAQWLQKYLIEKMNVPENLGITIRVKKKRGRYYVSEWRTGQQSFSGKTIKHPIARLSPVADEPDQWQLAWMRSNRRWYNLGEEYRGPFEYCAHLILKDPDHCFWG
jgi:hypothetical protein